MKLTQIRVYVCTKCGRVWNDRPRNAAPKSGQDARERHKVYRGKQTIVRGTWPTNYEWCGPIEVWVAHPEHGLRAWLARLAERLRTPAEYDFGPPVPLDRYIDPAIVSDVELAASLERQRAAAVELYGPLEEDNA